MKICVVGCGGMSSAVHGPSHQRYAAKHENTELAACCDLDEEKAIRYRDRFGFRRHTTDYPAMLDAERPDAVCLIVREPLTCELSCDILSRGYPLMMEKPPGTSTDELNRMIAAADATGVPTQVAFNRRHMPLVRELRRLLTERFAPGDVQHIRCDFVRVNRHDADFSATAIHGIDTVRFLARSDYRHVRFHYQPFPHLGATVANVFMDCTFECGTTAHLAFCPVAGAFIESYTAHADGHSFFVHTSRTDSPGGVGMLRHIENNEVRLALTNEEAAGGSEEILLAGFYQENAAFFDAIRNGLRPVDDLRSAQQAVEIAQCLRERGAEYCA